MRDHHLFPAPETLINKDGRPLFGQINGIPKKLGLEHYERLNDMDKPVRSLNKHFAYKQFQFVSVFVDHFVIGVAIADIRYLGSAFCYVYDLNEDRMVEENWLRPLHFDKQMSESPYQGTSWIAGKRIQFHILDASWQVSINTSAIQASLSLTAPPDSKPLSMCTPTGYSGWTYTAKHNALSVTGELTINGLPIKLDSALAGYDFSAGYMRRETSWRWASISTQIAGATLGLNLAAGVNETGSCENAMWVNGQRHLLGPVHFEFQRTSPHCDWRLFSESGEVDLLFTPKNKRSEKLNLWLLKSNFRQFIGRFSGTLTDNSGQVHTLDNVLGLTEDHFARW